jgi:uncharacterized membrane protein YjjP (DUF1212 family)
MRRTSALEANASMAKLYDRISKLARKLDEHKITREEALRELEEIAADDTLWLGFMVLMMKKGVKT